MSRDISQRIAIIGFGIMGLCTALRLIDDGYEDITVFNDPDKKPASRCAGGMLAPYSEGDTLHPSCQSLIFQYSLPFWRSYSEKLNFYYRDSGTLVLAHNADAGLLSRFELHLPDGSYERLNQGDIANSEPCLNNRFAKGLWIPEEAFVDTSQVMKRFRNHVIGNAAYSETTTDPHLLSQLGYDVIIDCRGIHANLDGMRPVKGERIYLHCEDMKLNHCIRLMHPRYPLYVVPHADHRFVVGATMIEDNQDDRATTRSILEMLSAFTSLSSLALESSIINIETGMRPTYQNHLPQIDVQAVNDAQVIYCNGLYRHGFLMAPVLAEGVRGMLGGEGVSNSMSALIKYPDQKDKQHEASY